MTGAETKDVSDSKYHGALALLACGDLLAGLVGVIFTNLAGWRQATNINSTDTNFQGTSKTFDPADFTSTST